MKDQYFLMEEITDCTTLMVYLPMKAFVSDFTFYKNKYLQDGILESKGSKYYLIFKKKQFYNMGKDILEKLLKNPQWGLKLNKLIENKSKLFFNEAKKLKKLKLKNKTNNELSKIYSKISKVHIISHETGIPWVALEFEHQQFTKHLLKYLKSKGHRKDKSIGQIFSILTTPKKESYAQKEENDLMKITIDIQNNEKTWKLFIKTKISELDKKLKKVNPKIWKKIDKHHKKYCWLSYMYIGPAWKKNYFYSTLSGIVKQNPNCKEIHNEIIKRRKDEQIEKKKLIKELKINKKHQTLFKVAKGMVYTKEYRKDALYHGTYCCEELYKECAKRMNLSIKQFRFITPDELPNAIKEGKFSVKELNNRIKHQIITFHREKSDLYSSKKADKLSKKIKYKEEIKKEVKELFGDCASPGFKRGIVKFVNSPKEMKKMNKGDILVSHATNPNIVPAMKKAGAIITEMGEMTCHAAIVSRELRTPCIVGVKNVMKILEEDELIEIDATHGRIRRIQKEN